MRCVRIWFDKTGEIKYISHLDLMRCFTRAIRRAKIPLWFTEGFNPRPYMQFALPLSLGMQSVCESVDIRIEGEISNAEILKRLKSVMPSGIIVKSVTEPVFDPKKIAFGEFDITFSLSGNTEKLRKLIEDTLLSDAIIVEKLGKKGRQKVMKEINLKEYISSSEIRVKNSDVICTLILPAGCTTNINPSLFSDKICLLSGENLAVDILRKRLMTENEEDFK